MTTIGKPERETLDRVIALLQRNARVHNQRMI
jgi:hypothetical protein